jgi:hypothetical protein
MKMHQASAFGELLRRHRLAAGLSTRTVSD